MDPILTRDYLTKKYVTFPRQANVSASCKIMMNEHCEGEGDSVQVKNKSYVMSQRLEACPLTQFYQAKRLQKQVGKNSSSREIILKQ